MSDQDKDLEQEIIEKEQTNDAPDTNKDEKDGYEDICYICRRPESKAGKMIKIPNNICICRDCMQKTFDSMSGSGFNLGDFNPANMGFGNMPNISMMDLSSIPNQVSEKQRVKKKKKTEEKQELKNDKSKKAEEKEDYVTVTASSVEELLKKINDTIYDSMSDHVKTPQEQLLGQHINFSA